MLRPATERNKEDCSCKEVYQAHFGLLNRAPFDKCTQHAKFCLSAVTQSTRNCFMSGESATSAAGGRAEDGLTHAVDLGSRTTPARGLRQVQSTSQAYHKGTPC